jgi:uncharacterized protein YbjT (DUF2867 family)
MPLWKRLCNAYREGSSTKKRRNIMSKIIAVAGATGNIGTRVVRALGQQGATVRALVRASTKAEARTELERLGAEVVSVDMNNAAALSAALEGSESVVSTLSGLRDVIVDTQSKLLDAAVAAGVPRFIASDFACDFTRLDDGENRNFDLRREFNQRLDKAPIAGTSIFNGGFADMLLSGQGPFFDISNRRVQYWESPDQAMDFTTMNDVAHYTALAALDPSAPRALRIAGDVVSARDMAALATEISGVEFSLFRLGTADELARKIRDARAADPESENQVFPVFQQMQYMHNMFSGRAKILHLDNARYPSMQWTTLRDLLASNAALKGLSAR